MQQIFAKAAEQGVAMSRVIAFESRQPEARVYPDRMWESPFIGNSSTFDPQGYFNLEARTTFHFTADGITPAMAMQMPEGKGSRYQTTYKDGDGSYLDGSKIYKLNMPPKVPVALFWSVILYDPWTRCELQSQPYPSISSQSDPGAEDERRRLHRHLLLGREARGRSRSRTGSRPCRTGVSSSTSATTVRSRRSTTRPGCPTTWSW